MTWRRWRLVAALAVVVAGGGGARAQMVVFDPGNYAQNVLRAARALQQINNQIVSLQNQAQMLINETRNLTSLPYSALAAIDQSIARTQQLLNDAQRIPFTPGAVNLAFTQSYPMTYPASVSSQQLLADAQTRWQNAMAGYQDALRVQAGIVQGLGAARSQQGALLSSSQGATGILQASQAGNQLIALQTRQLADLTALMAAQSRAQSLDGARLAAGDAQGQARARTFLTPGSGWQAQPVQMFH